MINDRNGDRSSEPRIRILSAVTLFFARERGHIMAKLDDHPLNEDSTPTPKKENRAWKSWPEEHGGLIFLIIVVSVISLVILYEFCMG
jgi:hypothetical protein